ncbi:CYTH and CHAD domain-containing protein [Mycobacterium sp.]|uniref:CYTH and CHAD domain-containing protein n=1 Tax=Mycobacterium sp. TaxID=1785 RepID=UPI00126F65B9|nr:CYTH and CHAD domain-containing protein [Mycobacterium sp.]KAA8969292.1 MAG: CYTH and CHAD domain-containing protein [Mycobacterium sp.]
MAARAAKAADTTRHREVERKFDVDESTLSPSFAGLAAITRIEKQPTQTLHAVYVDTPGRDLAANRITLRRRSGGSDAGWHLKLPAGPDARTEIRTPLGAEDADRDPVPDALRDVVAAIVRDRPLRPVAQITTNRDVHLLCGQDGAVLAEFCDDEVCARLADAEETQRWREWELELVGPDAAGNTELLDRLSNRLIDAGATPSRHASKLARALGETAPPHPPDRSADPLHRAVVEQIDELLVWDRAVRADADDAVHQMRVTTRKIRSLLRVAPDAFGLSDQTWILDELRELAAVLGVARDAEVLGMRYQQALDRLPPELVRGPVRKRLVDGARRRYRTGLQRALAALRSQRYFRLLDALDAVVASSPSRHNPESTPVDLDAAYQRVRKAAKAAARAAEADRDKALHRTRISAKRLRYAAAATGATKLAEQAKTIQTLLGDHQDSVVSREHLLRQADAAHAAGEDTFTYGLLYQQEADLAQHCREQLDAAMRKLDKAARKVRH